MKLALIGTAGIVASAAYLLAGRPPVPISMDAAERLAVYRASPPRPDIPASAGPLNVQARTPAPLHPAVRLVAPDKISSFRDPAVRAAYDVYFSLIGPAKERFPFGGSPLDSTENAALAGQKLLELSYRGRRPTAADFQESLLQITHLAHAEAAGAQELRERVVSKWISAIENPNSKKAAALHELDLRTLFTEMPEREAEKLPALYRNTQSIALKQSIAFALVQRMENQGLSDGELRLQLANEGIAYPELQANPPGGGK